MKLFLAIAVERGWFIEQMDFENAFLYGDMDQSVDLELPKHKYNESER